MARKIFFFYLEQKIKVSAEKMTGLQIKEAIKSVVAGFDLSHELVEEGHGDHVDEPITDDQLVDLVPGHGHGPRSFFSRPPTNFGDR